MHGTELWLWHRASFWQPLQPWFVRALLSRLETHVLPIALCKSTRIRLVPNSWIVCFGLWHRASFWQPLQPWFVKETVLAAFATLVCQRNCVFLCKGTKLKNSACAEFLDSLLWFVAQSFAFASGSSCFNNSCVQKHKNSACAEFLDSLLCFCGTELGFCTQIMAQSFGVVAQSFVLASKYP